MSDWICLEGVVHKTIGRTRWRFSTGLGTSDSSDLIAQAVISIPGVISCRVNPGARSIIVNYDNTSINNDKLSQAISDLKEPRNVNKKIQGALDFDLPIKGGVLLSLLVLLFSPFFPWKIRKILTIVASYPVVKHAITDFRKNGITSHVLEALAIGISIYRRDYTAANVTVFMLSLGEYIEDSISRKSDDMLKNMLQPVSEEIWIEKDGQEELIPSEHVTVGDIVIVGAGNVVPVDGTVLHGLATVNESSMTGESVPVRKERGSSVLSGTHVEEGRMKIYAEHVGSTTVAARISEYVKQSLVVKSNAQLEAARLADSLVPWVLGMAGGAYLLSGDATRAAAVLQADYSCALKLATPVAYKSAMYIAGQYSMLVKGASALEKLAQADTFIFDKTGTLTEGMLQVTDSIAFDSTYTPDDLIILAASVEEHYFHPLALAVVNAAKSLEDRHFAHKEVEFIVAHGVVSEIDGKRIIVGSRHFLEEHEGIPFDKYADRIDSLYREGKILLYIGFGGALIGILALKDTVRHNARKTILQLRQLGVKKILLLTGDHRNKAREIAESLDIDDYYSELHPEDKVQILNELSNNGSKIAFIGDGINDAAAISGAHVGVAMENGADIARISADIVLMKDDVSVIADARALASETQKLIQSNYRITIGLNTAILGSAMLGSISPVTASVLHNGSTIAILFRALNSLSIR